VLTYGGGEPVVRRYTELGAKETLVVYNALDPSTHHPGRPGPALRGRPRAAGQPAAGPEERIEEFFLRPASLLPDRTFLLAGNGWHDKPVPPNVRLLGHVGTADHNAFNSTPLAVSNVTRDSMVANGWSPATRVFEVGRRRGRARSPTAGRGSRTSSCPTARCSWPTTGRRSRTTCRSLDREHATQLGKAAWSGCLSEHTYGHRAVQVDQILRERIR
jgi:hypothetical protein